VLDLPLWSVAPFVLLLLAIAILPLVAGHWWHYNRNRAIVVAACAIPVAAFLVYEELVDGLPALKPLADELGTYVSFILLLGSLYVVSGGIVLSGELEPRPLTNTAFLALGAVLANLIGTTGASVLMIRPVLRINQGRQHKAHVPVFFIFTVSNLGGLLTPLGDPPLFLGFLNGVPFSWTLSLWPHWLVANGIVLAIFFVWDMLAYRREAPASRAKTSKVCNTSEVCGEPERKEGLRLSGMINLGFLAGIMVAILIQEPLPSPWGEIIGGAIMLAMGMLSLCLTPRALREANGFSWGPILEVAILFAGIFIAMVPALEILGVHGKELGITAPWHYFWLTGILSSFLDNAPTYMTFATLAAGSGDFSLLVHDQVPGINGPLVLKAISCGAVFMGALTYIGNGPNFMVKAIAEQAGFRTPTFLGYLVYSYLILVPVFVIITIVFFAGP
jgi:Na+/H+ antiporter NhaD/arsenite permease-like protein